MELQHIHTKIHLLRCQRVMLDFDLAELYEVETRSLKQAVRRNIRRFPSDFLFELDESEIDFLVSQFVIPSKKHFGGAAPFAFTEQGVAMLSSVLRSEKAIEANIAIMRAFVALRHFALSYTELAQKIAEIEARLGKEVGDIHEVLRWLGEENQNRHDEIKTLQPSETDTTEWQNRPRIGFKK